MKLCSFIHAHLLLCNMKIDLLLKDWVLDGKFIIDLASDISQEKYPHIT